MPLLIDPNKVDEHPLAISLLLKAFMGFSS